MTKSLPLFLAKLAVAGVMLFAVASFLMPLFVSASNVLTALR